MRISAPVVGGCASGTVVVPDWSGRIVVVKSSYNRQTRRPLSEPCVDILSSIKSRGVSAFRPSFRQIEIRSHRNSRFSCPAGLGALSLLHTVSPSENDGFSVSAVVVSSSQASMAPEGCTVVLRMLPRQLGRTRVVPSAGSVLEVTATELVKRTQKDTDPTPCVESTRPVELSSRPFVLSCRCTSRTALRRISVTDPRAESAMKLAKSLGFKVSNHDKPGGTSLVAGTAVRNEATFSCRPHAEQQPPRTNLRAALEVAGGHISVNAREVLLYGADKIAKELERVTELYAGRLLHEYPHLRGAFSDFESDDLQESRSAIDGRDTANLAATKASVAVTRDYTESDVTVLRKNPQCGDSDAEAYGNASTLRGFDGPDVMDERSCTQRAAALPTRSRRLRPARRSTISQTGGGLTSTKQGSAARVDANAAADREVNPTALLGAVSHKAGGARKKSHSDVDSQLEPGQTPCSKLVVAAPTTVRGATRQQAGSTGISRRRHPRDAVSTDRSPSKRARIAKPKWSSVLADPEMETEEASSTKVTTRKSRQLAATRPSTRSRSTRAAYATKHTDMVVSHREEKVENVCVQLFPLSMVATYRT